MAIVNTPFQANQNNSHINIFHLSYSHILEDLFYKTDQRNQYKKNTDKNALRKQMER